MFDIYDPRSIDAYFPELPPTATDVELRAQATAMREHMHTMVAKANELQDGARTKSDEFVETKPSATDKPYYMGSPTAAARLEAAIEERRRRTNRVEPYRIYNITEELYELSTEPPVFQPDPLLNIWASLNVTQPEPPNAGLFHQKGGLISDLIRRRDDLIDEALKPSTTDDADQSPDTTPTTGDSLTDGPPADPIDPNS